MAHTGAHIHSDIHAAVHSAPDSVHFSGHRDPKSASSGVEPVDLAVAKLAARQYGVVSIGQLERLGLTPTQVRGRLRRGVLHRLYRGVFAVGHRQLTRNGHLLAALYTSGDRAFLSHRTAAGLHGLCGLNAWRIELSAPGLRAGAPGGVVRHGVRGEPPADEIVVKGALRLSSVPRLLIELAPREHQVELERLITVAVRKQILNHERLEALLERHRRRPGIGRLRRAYAAYRPRPQRNSSLERDFDRLLERHPEVPEPLRNVWLGRWELDYYWPAERRGGAP